jgi:stage V sporulation protein G
MKIEVKVFKNEGGKNPVGSASVTYEKKFIVTGFKIMTGKSGLFVSMPSIKKADGTYKDTAYPLDKAFREELTKLILAEYQGENNTDGFPFN